MNFFGAVEFLLLCTSLSFVYTDYFVLLFILIRKQVASEYNLLAILHVFAFEKNMCTRATRK